MAEIISWPKSPAEPTGGQDVERPLRPSGAIPICLQARHDMLGAEMVEVSRYRLITGRTPLKKQFWRVCTTLAAVVILAIALASPAAAKIECRGAFQITKYGPLATPYCQEREIARVARSYGTKVTDAEVRKNPLTKVYLCQRYGADNRLKGSCGAYSPENYGR